MFESHQGMKITYFHLVIELGLYSFPMSEQNADDVTKQVVDMFDIFANVSMIETGYEIRYDPKNLAKLKETKQFGRLFTTQFVSTRFLGQELKKVEVVTTC